MKKKPVVSRPRSAGRVQETDEWGLDLESSRLLNSVRIPEDNLCWWCRKNLASTREHKFKKTDLGRMASRDEDGKVIPSSLQKISPTFSGNLKTIKKNNNVQWSKSLCKECNGGRDHEMDSAYEIFSDYVWNMQEEVDPNITIDWEQLYGVGWRNSARNMARYFAKQVGCMLAQQRLPISSQLIEFLDGANSADGFSFLLVRDKRRQAAHVIGKRFGYDPRGYQMPPVRAERSSSGRSLVYFSYQYFIGFIGVVVEFSKDQSRPSFFEQDSNCHIFEMESGDPGQLERYLLGRLSKN